MSAVVSQRPQNGVVRAIVGTRSPVAALAVLLLGLVLLFSLTTSEFLTVQNFLGIGSYVAILAIISTGTTFGVVSGALDISVGSTLALAGVSATILVSNGMSVWISVAAALGIGLAVGAANAVAVVKLRVNPIIATLGMLSIVRGIAYWIAGGSGGAMSPVVPEALTIMQGETLGVPRPVWVAAVTIGVGYLILQRTRFGLYAYAIGRSPEAGRAVALPVDRLRAMYLMLSGLCAGFGGWVMASAQGGLNANAGIGIELVVITAIFLGGAGITGGTGSMTGTLMGVLVVGVVANGLALMGVQAFYQLIVTGVILLIAVGLDALKTGGYR